MKKIYVTGIALENISKGDACVTIIDSKTGKTYIRRKRIKDIKNY
jgi:hypothetical protein